MVHGVRIRDGQAEWYRNRFVRDDTVTEVKGWPRTPGPRHGMGSGTANTNVIGHAGRTFAIVEAGGLPVELTYDLDTVQMSDFDGTLPGSFTAHPKRDPRDRRDCTRSSTTGSGTTCSTSSSAPTGACARTVDIPVPGKPMVHDCAITESQVVVIDLPVTFDLDAAMSGNGDAPVLVEPRLRRARRPAATRRVEWRCDALVRGRPLLRVPPAERVRPAGRSRRVRRVRHPKMFDKDRNGPNEGAPSARALDDRSRRRAASHEDVIDDRGQEFPRHDERLIGRKNRYGYTAAFGFGPRARPTVEARPRTAYQRGARVRTGSRQPRAGVRPTRRRRGRGRRLGHVVRLRRDD